MTRLVFFALLPHNLSCLRCSYEVTQGLTSVSLTDPDRVFKLFCQAWEDKYMARFFHEHYALHGPRDLVVHVSNANEADTLTFHFSLDNNPMQLRKAATADETDKQRVMIINPSHEAILDSFKRAIYKRHHAYPDSVPAPTDRVQRLRDAYGEKANVQFEDKVNAVLARDPLYPQVMKPLPANLLNMLHKAGDHADTVLLKNKIDLELNQDKPGYADMRDYVRHTLFPLLKIPVLAYLWLDHARDVLYLEGHHALLDLIEPWMTTFERAYLNKPFADEHRPLRQKAYPFVCALPDCVHAYGAALKERLTPLLDIQDVLVHADPVESTYVDWEDGERGVLRLWLDNGFQLDFDVQAMFSDAWAAKRNGGIEKLSDASLFSDVRASQKYIDLNPVTDFPAALNSMLWADIFKKYSDFGGIPFSIEEKMALMVSGLIQECWFSINDNFSDIEAKSVQFQKKLDAFFKLNQIGVDIDLNDANHLKELLEFNVCRNMSSELTIDHRIALIKIIWNGQVRKSVHERDDKSHRLHIQGKVKENRAQQPEIAYIDEAYTRWHSLIALTSEAKQGNHCANMLMVLKNANFFATNGRHGPGVTSEDDPDDTASAERLQMRRQALMAISFLTVVKSASPSQQDSVKAQIETAVQTIDALLSSPLLKKVDGVKKKRRAKKILFPSVKLPMQDTPIERARYARDIGNELANRISSIDFEIPTDHPLRDMIIPPSYLDRLNGAMLEFKEAQNVYVVSANSDVLNLSAKQASSKLDEVFEVIKHNKQTMLREEIMSEANKTTNPNVIALQRKRASYRQDDLNALKLRIQDIESRFFTKETSGEEENGGETPEWMVGNFIGSATLSKILDDMREVESAMALYRSGANMDQNEINMLISALVLKLDGIQVQLNESIKNVTDMKSAKADLNNYATTSLIASHEKALSDYMQIRQKIKQRSIWQMLLSAFGLSDALQAENLLLLQHEHEVHVIAMMLSIESHEQMESTRLESLVYTETLLGNLHIVSAKRRKLEKRWFPDAIKIAVYAEVEQKLHVQIKQVTLQKVVRQIMNIKNEKERYQAIKKLIAHHTAMKDNQRNILAMAYRDNAVIAAACALFELAWSNLAALKDVITNHVMLPLTGKRHSSLDNVVILSPVIRPRSASMPSLPAHVPGVEQHTRAVSAAGPITML